MQDVTINGCTFTSNDAYDGYAMYIEGDDPENSFVIKDNTFVDNHDGTDKTKSLIASEIQRLNNNDVVEKNNFSNENSDIVIPPIVVVDHEAQPLITSEPDTPTNKPPTPPTQNTEKLVTPNPEVPSDDEWGDDDTFELINATSKGRHEYIYTDPTTTYLIVVKISHFYNIHSTKDGGAIHITNAGITCNNTLFENCTTTLAGGGIYLKNEFDTSNVAALFDNNFTDCKAAYGGGIYVFSSNRKNNVEIHMCTFFLNQATATEADGGKYGGSGIYATIRKGKIRDCIFNDVPCDGSYLKLDNSFRSKAGSLNMLSSNQNKKKNTFIVSGCNFNFIQNEPASGVFFVRGNSDVFVELTDCKFNGKLAKDSHYIDGEII